ncbi:uncharacterized protein [Oryza sativa Japonica Group]|uniref:uncharacterized protein n=1 Tax=Oryza sativa subsp. japonica TaxID=39947 RepID=UPI0001C7CCA6|nr:F-box domain-containing protein [Oryza sativa Japonica Group]
MDLEALPGDVLEEVLRRLPPRSLAACRCVCSALRALVDDRRVLRADLLPLKLAGIFIGVIWVPQFFARPVLPHALDLTRLPETMLDCRNGLLLAHNVVVNPATGRWARLPRSPPPPPGCSCNDVFDYLVFDPTVSAHYEVYKIPSPFGDGMSDWPPSPFIIDVFSSKTLQWEKRSYVREGEAAGTVANLLARGFNCHQRSALWRGALYVPCETDFVTRISLSDGKYQVIKSPIGLEAMGKGSFLQLGKSKDGVCAFAHDDYQLCVWFLNESCGQMNWELKHQTHLWSLLAQLKSREHLAQCKSCKQTNGHWKYYDGNLFEEQILQTDLQVDTYPENDYQAEEDEFGRHFDTDSNYYDAEEYGWASDEDGECHSECNNKYGEDELYKVDKLYNMQCQELFYFFGFHPYRDVVFLHVSSSRAVAYHLNSSKVRDLGVGWEQHISAGFSKRHHRYGIGDPSIGVGSTTGTFEAHARENRADTYFKLLSVVSNHLTLKNKLNHLPHLTTTNP